MAPDDDKPDPKVKELLERDLGRPLKEVVDEVTAAELERWFGLPSYQQVEEGEVKPAVEDPQMIAVRERRAKAVAAVEPWMLEGHRRRTEPPDDLLKFRAVLESRIDPSITRIDLAAIENKLTSTEPRERQRPDDIEEELQDNTPQALLRDLHRPELDFEKKLEVIDMAAEQRLDIVAEVTAAMATNWKLPPLDETPGQGLRALFVEIRAERDAPWKTLPLRINLPNRRVSE